jgi:hypothetical protein
MPTSLKAKLMLRRKMSNNPHFQPATFDPAIYNAAINASMSLSTADGDATEIASGGAGSGSVVEG